MKESDPISRNARRTFGGLVLDVAVDLALLAAGSLLFWLAFPNVVTPEGFLFPLAFVSVIPVFIVVHRSSWPRLFPYAVFYAFLTYALFNYWLSTFHPIALVTVQLLASVWFLLLFPALKLIDVFFPNYGYVFQAFAWIGFEYLRTLGFLGYSYGILGYSQYLFLPLARIASLTGVWGVSFMLVFPQTYTAFLLSGGIRGFSRRVKKHVPVLAGYVAVFAAVLAYGAFSAVDYGSSRSLKVSLVQQNSDPWKDNYEEYERTLDSLVDLSTRSITEKPDIVIWSETAFVPAIEYHLRYRESQEAVRVVKKLIEFLDTQTVPYVIGNDDGVKIRQGTPEEERIDYNSVLLFDKSKIVEKYRKLHLVPFTEYFPYKNIFPALYDFLVGMDTHFWEKGTEYTVFESLGVRFSTPICFEDTFGYLSRRFCENGAELIVNLSNDTWSGSVVAEVQHLAMGVFRAIENRRSMVRSTNSGITCVVDPNGLVIKRLEPFTKGYLVAGVPVYSAGRTLYNAWGDWFACVLFCGALASLGTGTALVFLRGKKARTNTTGILILNDRREKSKSSKKIITPYNRAK